MTRRLLFVTWRAGEAEDSRPVVAITSRLPACLGKTGLTIGRTIRVRPSRYHAFEDAWTWAPFWRHELTHVPQWPAGFLPRVWHGIKYVVWPPFRHRIEAEAHAAEQVAEQQAGGNPFPHFRMVAP